MSYGTRFAPSPSGLLHIGHAFSALTAYDRAHAQAGRFLLRIEDIDRARCTHAFETAIYDDLAWLGLHWPRPVMRQSERQAAYLDALNRLSSEGLCYPCRCTRGDIRAALSAPQENAAPPGRDGPVYPGTCRGRAIEDAKPGDSIRLNIAAALARAGTALRFHEHGTGSPVLKCPDPADMIATVGDVVLARRDIGTSYHLAVVVDDAAQGITEIVRGADLLGATPLHVLLQILLDLPRPDYFHHRLVRDDTGRRLAKRDNDRAIAAYRSAGATPEDIRALVGL